jgi:uncharacterized protein DUF4116
MTRALQLSAVRSTEQASRSLGPESTADVNPGSRADDSGTVSPKNAAATPDTFVRLARPQPVAGAGSDGQAATTFSLRSRRKRPEAPESGPRLEGSPSRAALQAMLKELDAPSPRSEEPQTDRRPVQAALEKGPEAAPAPAAAPAKPQESPAQPLPAPPAGAVPALADVTSEDLSRPGVREALAERLSTSPEALAGASEAVRSDRELVLTALQHRVRMGRGWTSVLKGLPAQIGQTLLADPEIALACIRIVPDFVSQLPESARTPALVREALERGAPCSDPRWLEDRQLVLAGARGGGIPLSKLPAAFLKDPEIVLTALEKTQRLRTIKTEEVLDDWKCIDPSLREDREFQKKAVLADPAFLQVADEKLKGDRDLVLEAVRRCGRALQFASPELRADREVVRTAVEGDGVALQFADEKLKADRDLAMAALKDMADAFYFLPDSLKKDPEFLLKAARMLPGVLSKAELEGQSRDFLLQLVREHSRVFTLLPEAVRKDREFQLQCAMSYPPMLDVDLADQKSALLDASPELRKRYETVTKELGELGIETVTRFHNAKLLEEVLRNRKNPSVDDGRPVAVVVYPKAKGDPSGAYDWTTLAELTQRYRVMYYEEGTDVGVIDALKEGGKARPADLVVLAGHGQQGVTSLSWGHGVPQDSEILDVEDERQLVDAGVEPCVQPGASIVLLSCSTGEGRQAGDNNANMLARVFPGREVLAPVVNSGAQLKFDEQGRFSDPGFVGGDEVLYRARVPKA